MTEGIVFEDESATKTKVKITNDKQSLRIIPYCIQRIAVSGEPSPKYEPQGVSRDNPIMVRFTKELNPQSFIFKQSELPEGADAVKDTDQNIWAYTLNGQTYFKNITITNEADFSLAEYFTQPKVEGSLLTIEVNENNQIPFEPGVLYKTIKVSLSQGICDIDSVNMSSEQAWNYRINSTTNEKSQITITAPTGTGTLTGAQGTASYSIGEEIPLSFEENPDYKFVGWTITTIGQSVDDSQIKIDDESSAITKLHIYKKVSGVTVTAKAVLMPKVVSVSPNESQQVLTYSPIVIKFNMPMEDSDTTNSQFTWHNIFIKANNVKIEDCFSSITLNKEKTVLTIIPDYIKLNNYIENVLKQPYLPLEISLDNISVKKDDIEIPLMESGSKFTVVYKIGQDTEPPVITDWYMTRYEITPSTNLDDSKKFIKKTSDAADFLENAVFANLAEDCVYFWGKVYDADSGLQKIIVKQTREAYRLAKTVSNWGITQQREEVSEYTLDSSNVQYERDGNGNTIFCIKIDILIPTCSGGADLFEISVEDACNNRNNIPDPCISAVVTESLDIVHFPFSCPFFMQNSYDDPTTIILPHRDVYKDMSNYSLYYAYPNEDPDWKGFIPGKDLDFQCEYIDKDGIKRLEDFPSYEQTKNETGRPLKLNLDENKLDNASYKIIAKYKGYELWTKDFTFPKKPLITSIDSNNGETYIKYVSPDGYNIEAYSYTQDEGYVLINRYDGSISSEYDIYLVSRYTVKNKPGISPYYGTKAGPYRLDENSQSFSNSKPNTPVIKKSTITKSATQSECVDIALDVECDGKKWSEVYDSIYLECKYLRHTKNTYSSNEVIDKYLINSGENVSITIQTRSLCFEDSWKPVLTIYGIKNGLISDSGIYKVAFADEQNILDCDNYPPYYSEYCYESDSNTYKVCFMDFESGATSAKVTCNGKVWDQSVIDNSTGWCAVNIPVDELLPGKKTLVFEMKDKAGNVSIKKVEFDGSIVEILRDDKFSKEDGKWKPVFYDDKAPLTDVNDGAVNNEAIIYFYEFETNSWTSEPIYEIARKQKIVKQEDITYSVTGSKFVKVRYVRKKSYHCQDNYEIYYAGTESCTNAYNLLYSNGNSKTSMAVSSDAPVFVHTLATGHSYEECKNWSLSEWESFPREINPQKFTFDSSDRPKRYDIPMGGTTGVQSGECYIVIAHYADNSVLMSEVMVKE